MSATAKPIADIATDLNLKDDEWVAYGRGKAKIHLAALRAREEQAAKKLVLVTAMTPTPAGEGKTTTAIGLADSLRRIGKKSVVALREPSLGPCFGRKGGGTGNGKTQVVPADDINLHFTGDMHAITCAHNLLAAALDNHMFHGNELRLDPRNIWWPRAVDMNDRALRDIVVGQAVPTQSFTRKDSYLISAASEVMAVLCLSKNIDDLRERLGRMIIGLNMDGDPVEARRLGVVGSMIALLRDAMDPNLVQTREGTPAIVHGGPFANIAHGCNSLNATQLALRVGDICVTEAGFGSDLGAEKFFNIKCRVGGLEPDASVIVVTVRALKYHGGMMKEKLAEPNEAAVKKGLKNLDKHMENIDHYNVPFIVAINRFPTDTEDEVQTVIDHCKARGEGSGSITAVPHTCHDDGSEGGVQMAEALLGVLEAERAAPFKLLYPDEKRLRSKVNEIGHKMYDMMEMEVRPTADRKFRQAEEWGYGELSVCIAKTPASLSDDSSIIGRPRTRHAVVTDMSLSAGAGFAVVYCGNILTMPGLPQSPNAERIDVDADGIITGLF